MKTLPVSDADAKSPTSNATAMLCLFYHDAAPWLNQIQIAVQRMGGDADAISLLTWLIYHACKSREDFVPGAALERDRIRYEEVAWRRYREASRHETEQFCLEVNALKPEPSIEDYNEDMDGAGSEYGYLWERLRIDDTPPGHIPEALPWPALSPIERTHFRMAFLAAVQDREFRIAARWLPRLLRKIISRLRPSLKVIRQIAAIPSERRADEIRKLKDRYQAAERLIPLYQASLNAYEYVQRAMASYWADGYIDVLPAIRAAKQAWADYWRLTIPAIPLLESRKIVQECGCEGCLRIKGIL